MNDFNKSTKGMAITETLVIATVAMACLALLIAGVVVARNTLVAVF